MKKVFILLTASVVLFSCKKDKKDDQYFKGPETEMHHGKAWSSVTLTEDGAPLALAISLNEAALNSVPVGTGSGSGGEHHTHDNSVVLPLPQQALAVTPFKTIGLDWNPTGHPPAMYQTGHFDFHFYMITEAERLAATDMGKLNAEPAADYIPANYIPTGPVPQMGKHWVDITSPELNPNNPAAFTQTFIYGTYDSKVNFYEPMITLDFLKNTSFFERAIPQPAKVQQTGYYPTKMLVVKEKGVTSVILTGFQHRTAS